MFGHIREGGPSWEWRLRDGPVCVNIIKVNIQTDSLYETHIPALISWTCVQIPINHDKGRFPGIGLLKA